MGTIPSDTTNLPPEQQAIRAKCFHPSGLFTEFRKEEVERPITERFEKIVRLFPDRIAIKAGDQVVTYRKLNEMANGVARALTARRGSDPEPVAVLLAKGVEQTASIIGVLKARKFFVVLDPLTPGARIGEILQDSRAHDIITDRNYSSLAFEVTKDEARVVDVESIASDGAYNDLRLEMDAGAYAGIVYTSGSTGEPQGVIEDHRLLLHQVKISTDAYHVCQNDRITYLPFGNASALSNALLALLNGATLLPFDARAQGALRLAKWLAREHISICWISSPLFRSVCDTLTGEEHFPDVRLIRLTSDTVRKSDFELYRRHFSSDCVFGTGLSSSETQYTRLYFADKGTEIFDDGPVGYPVADKEILLLDEEGQDSGFNQTGEIVVRSRYLAPGYWRRPELTAARFKSDPASDNTRLYFSGDLGLMRPDGCLFHKGRKDFRVKVRGYRVEIAEVEKTLREHRGIKEAIVISNRDPSRETRLVAYYVPAADAQPSISELRSFLREKLPDYMVPAVFVVLDALPLTPSGKLDRKALAPLTNTRPGLDTPWVAPETHIEQKLAQIWTEVLCLDQVGVHDNFFELGGHSLAAGRIISHVVRTFQLELPIDALFNSPTVAEMSAVIAENQSNEASKDALSRMLAEVEGLTPEDVRRFIREEQHEN